MTPQIKRALPSRPKLVIFDQFKTLTEGSDEVGSDPEAAIIKHFGLAMPYNDVEKVVCGTRWKGERDYLNSVVAGLSLQDNADTRTQLGKILEQDVLRERIVDEAHHVLSTLQARGMRVALVSNAATPQYTHVTSKSSCIAHLFDAVAYSYETGHLKPDANIYQRVLDATSVSAQDAVMVGDSLRNDYEGALAAGIGQAVLLDRKQHHRDIYPRIDSLTELLELIPEIPNTNVFGQPVGFQMPDWTGCRSLPHTPMFGRTVRLEALSVATHGGDLADSFEADADGRLWTYLSSGPYNGNRAALDLWLAKCEDSADPLFFAIVSGESGRALGLVAYHRMQPQLGVAEIAHVTMSPALQRTIMSTEALYLMIGRVFELGYRRCEWKCDSLNGPSRRAAARLGFTFEGIFRQALVYKGRNRDTAWYSILDKEWPALKAKFERWLDPTNFDVTGCQKVTLATMHIGAPACTMDGPDLPTAKRPRSVS